MTPEQLQKEAREHFRNATKRPFTKEDTEALNNFHDELVAKVFLAGEKSGKGKEAEAWLLGKRCDNCGQEMERDPISKICASCWEDG